jgi:hypothetical protein
MNSWKTKFNRLMLPSNRKNFITIFFVIWVFLWIMFMLRENKPGQYADLRYYYAHSTYSDKMKHMIGEGLYDFLAFSQETLPSRATYNILGIKHKEKRSRDLFLPEIQVRYFLWPLEMNIKDPNFLLYFDSPYVPIDGYKFFKQYKDSFILIKAENK